MSDLPSFSFPTQSVTLFVSLSLYPAPKPQVRINGEIAIVSLVNMWAAFTSYGQFYKAHGQSILDRTAKFHPSYLAALKVGILAQAANTGAKNRRSQRLSAFHHLGRSSTPYTVPHDVAEADLLVRSASAAMRYSWETDFLSSRG